jgi:hypothetical protein
MTIVTVTEVQQKTGHKHRTAPERAVQFLKKFDRSC